MDYKQRLQEQEEAAAAAAAEGVTPDMQRAPGPPAGQASTNGRVAESVPGMIDEHW